MARSIIVTKDFQKLLLNDSQKHRLNHTKDDKFIQIWPHQFVQRRYISISDTSMSTVWSSWSFSSQSINKNCRDIQSWANYQTGGGGGGYFHVVPGLICSCVDMLKYSKDEPPHKFWDGTTSGELWHSSIWHIVPHCCAEDLKPCDKKEIPTISPKLERLWNSSKQSSLTSVL